jgi:hypothetical protein
MYVSTYVRQFGKISAGCEMSAAPFATETERY